jgi:hypothetical protein
MTVDRRSVHGILAAFATLLVAPLACLATASAAGTSAVVGTLLTWIAPTTNADGSALADLLAFNVYHGTSPATMMMAASLASTARNYTDADLTPGVWYWYVTTVNALGVESAPSALVSQTIVASTLSAALPANSSPTGTPGAAPAAAPGGSPTPAGAPAAAAGVPGSMGDPGGATAWPTPAANGPERSEDIQHRSLCRPRGQVWCFRP